MVSASGVPEPPPERPRSVNIVGGAFLVLSSIRFMLDALGWIVWKLGNPGPLIAFFLPSGRRGFVPVEWVLRHFPTVVAVQGTVALAVALISLNFLRLRPWARPTLEVVAWLALAVTSALVGAFGYAETRVPGGANLAGAILWLVALDVLLAVAIRAIRKPDVRAAFRAEISSAP